MERALGVDGDMLRKVYGIFCHCRKPASATVRKGDYVSMLQKNPSLMASFTNTPLCSEAFSVHAARPQVWGDILVHLNCHESDVLTWAAVLEVIRWHCDLCFDRVGATAVGPGGHRCERGLPGPAFSNGNMQSRLATLMTGDESPAMALAPFTVATPVRAGGAIADTRITNAPRGADSGGVVIDEPRVNPSAAALPSNVPATTPLSRLSSLGSPSGRQVQDPTQCFDVNHGSAPASPAA